MLDTVWKKKDKNDAFQSIRMFWFFFLKTNFHFILWVYLALWQQSPPTKVRFTVVKKKRLQRLIAGY